MKILEIGPSPTRSQGGMAAVLQGLLKDKANFPGMELRCYESYIDGPLPIRVLFSLYSFLRFLWTGRGYNGYHIHAATGNSIYRKMWYLWVIKRWKKPVFVEIHGGKFVEFYQGCSKKRQKAIVSALMKADRVIALSEKWKMQYEQILGLSNCVVLENGIDMETLAAGKAEPAQTIGKFLFLGKVCEEKGAFDLVTAFKTAAKSRPDIRLTFAGNGELDRLQSQIRAEAPTEHITIAGWCDERKKIRLLKECAVVILPSYFEAMPMAVLEGMACGKAIISTRVGAIPEIVKEKNGILISPGDGKALEEAILRCASDLPFLKTAAEANEQLIAERFSMDNMHKKLYRMYVGTFAQNIE